MGDGDGQFDMAHALAAHLGLGHFDAAAVADDALELHPAVLAAGALVVVGRAENAFAEKAVALGLERAVVDGFGLLDFAEGPGKDLLGAGEAEPDGVEIEEFERFSASLLLLAAETSELLVLPSR